MTYTADVSMFPYFKKDEVKTVKKVVVINDTQKKVWRLEAQNKMLLMELQDANRIADDYADESFGYEKGYKRLKTEIDFLVSKNVLHKEVEEQTTTIERLLAENKKLKAENENWKKIDMDLLESEYMMGKDMEIHKLKKEIKEFKADDVYQQKIIQKYNDENNMFHTEIKELKKSKEELYETIMELKNPVTNYDERCGVLKARFNHAYLAGFMYGHHIDIYKSRSVDEQQEFDGVIEHMSKEVENVIDTYLQDSLIYGTHMTLNEVIREKLDDIIDQAIDDGIVKEIDDSSDED
jgi:FtsZ-binding cell division protein ZapB